MINTGRKILFSKFKQSNVIVLIISDDPNNICLSNGEFIKF